MMVSTWNSVAVQLGFSGGSVTGVDEEPLLILGRDGVVPPGVVLVGFASGEGRTALPFLILRIHDSLQGGF
jgi:hypothetical protein